MNHSKILSIIIQYIYIFWVHNVLLPSWNYLPLFQYQPAAALFLSLPVKMNDLAALQHFNAFHANGAGGMTEECYLHQASSKPPASMKNRAKPLKNQEIMRNTGNLQFKGPKTTQMIPNIAKWRAKQKFSRAWKGLPPAVTCRTNGQ